VESSPAHEVESSPAHEVESSPAHEVESGPEPRRHQVLLQGKGVVKSKSRGDYVDTDNSKITLYERPKQKSSIHYPDPELEDEDVLVLDAKDEESNSESEEDEEGNSESEEEEDRKEVVPWEYKGTTYLLHETSGDVYDYDSELKIGKKPIYHKLLLNSTLYNEYKTSWTEQIKHMHAHDLDIVFKHLGCSCDCDKPKKEDKKKKIIAYLDNPHNLKKINKSKKKSWETARLAWGPREEAAKLGGRQFTSYVIDYNGKHIELNTLDEAKQLAEIIPWCNGIILNKSKYYLCMGFSNIRHNSPPISPSWICKT